MLNVAIQKAMSGKPGPVYLDLPGDTLYQMVDEDAIDWSQSGRAILNARPPAPAHAHPHPRRHMYVLPHPL